MSAPSTNFVRKPQVGARADSVTLDGETLFQFVYLVIDRYRFWIIGALSVLAAALMPGLFVKELLARVDNVSVLLVTVGGLLIVAALVLSLRVPVLSLLACVAVAFSSSSAVLHDKYGLPVMTKYLPVLILFALLVQWLLRIDARTAAAPRLQHSPFQQAAQRDASRWYLFCITLLGLYFVLTLLPVLYANNVELAMEELKLQRRNLFMCLAVALAVGQCGRWSSLRMVCRVGLYATSAAVLLAIIGAFFPSLESLLPGYTSVYYSIEPGSSGDRIAGAFGHPNTLGRYTVFMMPIAIGMVIYGSPVARLLAIVCFMTLMIGLVLSESRGAMLVLIIISLPGIVFLVRLVKLRYWLPALVLVAGAVLIAWEHVDTERMSRAFGDLERIVVQGEAPSDGAIRGRLSEMTIAWQLWKDNPVLGIGLANYEHYFQIYSFDHGTKLYGDDRSAHSLYMELLAERGAVGLIGFFLAIGGIVTTVFLSARRLLMAGETNEGILVLSLVTAAFAYYLSAVVMHDVHSEPIWALIGVMIASTRLLPGAWSVQVRPELDAPASGARRG